MKFLVTGGNGQLGMDIDSVFCQSNTVFALTKEQFDITNSSQINDVMAQIKPDCVINTAAMHHVEKCEADPPLAHAVNGIGTRSLAQECARHNAHLIHISTDYVFNGEKKVPYVESDVPCPLNVYGNSKLSGEYYALSSWEKVSVVRVGGIYGVHPCRAKGGLNFVQLMLKLANERPYLRVVDDEIVTPTPTAAIAAQLQRIANEGVYGIFHATCQGQCSWYAFAERIFALRGITTDLQKAQPGEFPAKVARPSYSVLENSRLKQLGIDCMPNWEDGLKSYLNTVG
ncbi:dTDP-4-dehydrorhamnose reductase [Desulfovibrio sp.]|uniref:dTDP-4-dehydrorhamnose reductase n=1 Tax=Desulfovibrio sp. TaxID=885 RepID=UPI0025C247C0|nr:dTDP-4-dehydrorhamnose reductase [Desulfovibrio sp.]